MATDGVTVDNPYGLGALWAQGDRPAKGVLILLAMAFPALPLAAMLAGIGADRLVSLGWRKSLVGLLIFALAANFIFTSSPEGYATAPGSPSRR